MYKPLITIISITNIVLSIVHTYTDVYYVDAKRRCTVCKRQTDCESVYLLFNAVLRLSMQPPYTLCGLYKSIKVT